MPLQEMTWYLHLTPQKMQVVAQMTAYMVILSIVYSELRLQVSLSEEADFLNFLESGQQFHSVFLKRSLDHFWMP
uniref:Uncharacterized protein n=1 Tax=Rhizophora mucronata TaxID=61149 RepID=A0A2P2M9G3_RHIMU